MRERKSYEETPSYMSENKLFIIFAALTFILFIALALFSYNSFIKGQESSEVVLIKADEQPYKVAPEDPGGMKVNYQDKEVFNTLVGKDNNTANAQQPVNVDEPQHPLSPEEVLRKAEGMNNDNAPTPAVTEQAASSATSTTGTQANAQATDATPAVPATAEPNAVKFNEAPAAAETPSTPSANTAPAKAEPAQEAKPANVDINQGVIKISDASAEDDKPAKTDVVTAETKIKVATAKVEEKSAEVAKPKSIVKKENGAANTLESSKTTKVKEEKATSSASTAAANKGGKYYVQLSAFSSMHALDKGWSDLKSKYSSAITGGKMVNKIERDGKTLYRLGFGPYKQKIAAVEACNKLKTKGQDCIVRDQ